jgi:hypothetical protein
MFSTNPLCLRTLALLQTESYQHTEERDKLKIKQHVTMFQSSVYGYARSQPQPTSQIQA